MGHVPQRAGDRRRAAGSIRPRLPGRRQQRHQRIVGLHGRTAFPGSQNHHHPPLRRPRQTAQTQGPARTPRRKGRPGATNQQDRRRGAAGHARRLVLRTRPAEWQAAASTGCCPLPKGKPTSTTPGVPSHGTRRAGPSRNTSGSSRSAPGSRMASSITPTTCASVPPSTPSPHGASWTSNAAPATRLTCPPSYGSPNTRSMCSTSGSATAESFAGPRKGRQTSALS